jgi:hypothetical protein
MALSDLRLIKRCAEFRPKEQIGLVPHHTRGLYALLHRRPDLKNKFDVVHVGMAGGTKSGIRGRLNAHKRSKRKSGLWTHFSLFQVWDNISEDEVKELEGLFRHVYRKDSRANKVNRQRSSKKLNNVRTNNLKNWPR